MMPPVRALALFMVVSGLAAGVGGWIGVRWALEPSGQEPELHALLHHKLHLTAEQQQRIDTLETAFAPEQRVDEGEMRAANQDLAEALGSEHAYGPRAQHAVQRFHRAMEALQEATIHHVMAMRQTLTPDQAQTFDSTVERALTAPPP